MGRMFPFKSLESLEMFMCLSVDDVTCPEDVDSRMEFLSDRV